MKILFFCHPDDAISIHDFLYEGKELTLAPEDDLGIILISEESSLSRPCLVELDSTEFKKLYDESLIEYESLLAIPTEQEDDLEDTKSDFIEDMHSDNQTEIQDEVIEESNEDFDESLEDVQDLEDEFFENQK